MTRETKIGLVVAGSFLCLVAIVVASIVVCICVKERFDSAGEKLGAIAFGVLFFCVGVWLAWPLALLIADWWTDSERLATYIDNRDAQEVVHGYFRAGTMNSTTWLAPGIGLCVASANSSFTLCGPDGSPTRTTVSPLVSTVGHDWPST